ncbi:MAG: protein translocase subunit SecD [Longimicrobiales bacterium]|nr:protein translocase subunit SecD [Longimicrobiales bacterium]
MFKSMRGRIIVIVLACLAAGYQLWSNGLKLGLDLQGGIHLVLEVDDPDNTLTDEARADAIDRAETVVRNRIDQFGVEEPLIQKSGGDRLIVELAGIDDEGRARDIIQQSAFLEFKLVRPATDLESALARIDRQIVAALGPDSLAALGRAVEQSAEAASMAEIEQLVFGGGGAATDSAATPDSLPEAEADTAVAEENAEPNLSPLGSLLLRDVLPTGGGTVGSFLVAASDFAVADHLLNLPEVRNALPRNMALHWANDPVSEGARSYRRLYVLEEDPFVTGDNLEDAIATRDVQINEPIVTFEFNRTGGRQFGIVTGANIGNAIAIVLDGEVMSAPTVQGRITTRGQIELGPGTPMEEAADLALVLRAGALPVPLVIMEERTVGPSLGQDSIDQGEIAGIVGLLLVLGIMILYYRMAGVLAVGALMIYVLLVLGGLAGLNATLTLPGIAGLILSIGMAVDANVLIFERIREELLAGRATRTAVEEGFGNAFSAILDANITTLITALILFQFGTGPVQGFAVTLSIGIVASFFSALYVTRTLFLVYISGKKASDPISI